MRRSRTASRMETSLITTFHKYFQNSSRSPRIPLALRTQEKRERDSEKERNRYGFRCSYRFYSLRTNVSAVQLSYISVFLSERHIFFLFLFSNAIRDEKERETSWYSSSTLRSPYVLQRATRRTVAGWCRTSMFSYTTKGIHSSCYFASWWCISQM